MINYAHDFNSKDFTLIIIRSKNNVTKGPGGFIRFKIMSVGSSGNDTPRIICLGTTQANHSTGAVNTGCTLCIEPVNHIITVKIL